MLSDADDGCSYLVCDYASQLGTDSNTGHMSLLAYRRHCAQGSAVPRHFPIGHSAPCSAFSTRCPPPSGKINTVTVHELMH